jgi:2-polyprenyl-3-methyl-5-hydroxy-6-metoxy-1,4-benzoquinol methylase
MSTAAIERRSYLARLFRQTEEENRLAILDLLDHDPNARLLDLGCYDGVLTARLAERIGTRHITGVEVVESIADTARAKGIDVVSADLNGAIPLPDRSFDVIHANQVIEHLWDTDTFVSEIARLLSPTGYAVISTNNLASLHNIVSLVVGRQPPPAHVSNRIIVGNEINPMDGVEHENGAMAHLRIFSYSALREFLAAYGLVPETYRTVGFYPLPVKVARLATKIAPVYGAFLTCKVRLAQA